MNLQLETPPTRPSRQANVPPQLSFSPTAWAKLLFLRDRGPTEVGGFGVSRADDFLLIEDVILVRQLCSPVSVVFDDEAVADFFDSQVDQGRLPQQFARIWIHTHPGASPQPSLTDEETFARVFGQTDWAVMFILAREGATYARLGCHVGPGVAVTLPTAVDYGRPFSATDFEAWNQEYLDNVDAEDWRLADLAQSPWPAGALARQRLAAEDHFYHEPLLEELFYDGFGDFGEQR